MEELATDKQINYMKALKMTIPNQLTKREARVLIDEFKKQDSQVRSDMQNPVVRPGEPKSNGFHLTPESCRVEALKIAIETVKAFGNKKEQSLMELADVYHKYITQN